MKTTIITLASVVIAMASCKPGEADTKAASAEVPAGTTDAIPYPMDTCLVSGEKLGGMGKPFEFVYQGQQIKFCCKNCKPDFEKEPEKYMAKLKEFQASHPAR